MASVSELILAAQAKQRKSPISAIADLINTGVSNYAEGQQIKQKSDLNRLEIASKLLQIKQAQDEMAAQQEMRQQLSAQLNLNSEKTVRDNLASTGSAPTPVTPANKVTQEISQDAKGHVSRSIKLAPPPETNSLEDILTQRVISGEMSIADAYKLKNEANLAGKGYRWMPDGTMQMIEGSAPDTTAKAAKAKADAAVSAQNAEAQAVLSKIAEAKSQAGAFTTGFFGNAMKDIAGTPAANLKETLKSIESSVGLGKLMEMKANSKAGASGMGALSDNEMQLLVASIASMKQAQSKEQFLKHMGDIETHYQNYLKMNQGINPFNQNGTPVDTTQATPSPTSPSAGPTPGPQKTPAQRFDEIVASGKSEGDAYKQLAKEGY